MGQRLPSRAPWAGPSQVSHTIEELGTLNVAFLHLLALVRRSLNVADCGGKDGSAALYQLLAEVNTIAGGGTVQRGPVSKRQGLWVATDRIYSHIPSVT